MFDNDKIINNPTTFTIYINTHENACTNIHNINIHSYTIQISGPMGLFSNKWANVTKYCGLDRTSVGDVLIVEFGNRSEFIKIFFNW